MRVLLAAVVLASALLAATPAASAHPCDSGNTHCDIHNLQHEVENKVRGEIDTALCFYYTPPASWYATCIAG